MSPELKLILLVGGFVAWCLTLRWRIKAIARRRFLLERQRGMLGALYAIQGAEITDMELGKLVYNMHRASYWTLHYPALLKADKEKMKAMMRDKSLRERRLEDRRCTK